MNFWLTDEQKLLLHAALFSGSDALKAWEKWTALINFDKIDPASFKLLPLIARNLAFAQIKTPLFAKCQGIYRQAWVANQIQWTKIVPTLAHFLHAGIDKIIILKGMAMTHQYYRDFGMRIAGDIDLMIEKVHLPQVNDHLASLGWKAGPARTSILNPEHLERWHSLNFLDSSKTVLDLHWSFIQENSKALDEAVLKEARPFSIQGITLYVPSPTDLLLQTCIHGVKPSPIPLIRWVADAVTILKQEEISWDRLITLSRAAHISPQIATALNYLVTHFNAPIPQTAISQLENTPTTPLQHREAKAASRGDQYLAAWYRYSINQNHKTTLIQLLHLPKYLQVTGRLKSLWHIPFYGIYWIFKQLLNSLR